MKSLKYLMLFSSLIVVFSCERESLDKKPLDSLTELEVWHDLDLVENYVWNNYNAFGNWGESNWALSDNNYPLFWPNVLSINRGNLDPENLGAYSGTWKNYYRFIRNVNIFLQNIDDVDGDLEKKDRLKGEMIFIRAFSYSQLLNAFGGVPIITETFDLDDNFLRDRDSYQNGVEFVVSELNKAAELVPRSLPSNEFGRITMGTVLAFKSQVLLYAASELHDPINEPSGPFYDYDVSTKWEDAADAAKEVIDLGDYSLVSVNDWVEYQEMFLHNNSEVIFAQPHSSEYVNDVSIDLLLTPNGYSGWSGSLPTQGLIDAFQMKDGKSIETSPLYDSDPELIYENRELRFYANIVYQGADYRGRQTEFYLPGGLDSKDGPEAHNYAVTGYTVRKHMDESIDFNSTNPETPNIFIRLAEVYLNYAEAQFHVGNEEMAREYVNKIRERVHLPAVHSSGKNLLGDIRHERRMELMFEGFNGLSRFQDLRRWKIAEDRLNESKKGIEWRKEDANGSLDSSGELRYRIINIVDGVFTSNMYFMPIPNSEIEKTHLEQNVGY